MIWRAILLVAGAAGATATSPPISALTEGLCALPPQRPHDPWLAARLRAGPDPNSDAIILERFVTSVADCAPVVEASQSTSPRSARSGAWPVESMHGLLPKPRAPVRKDGMYGSVVAAALLFVVFFVTSSDSGSLVIDSITAGGKVDAPVPQRIFWATMEGIIAAALLFGGGADALGALQAAAITVGLPFTVVLLAMCVALYMGLSHERKYVLGAPSLTASPGGG